MARRAELLELRARDRNAFLNALKDELGLKKLGERLRFEKELLSAQGGTSCATASASTPAAAAAANEDAVDVLSVVRASGTNLLELRDLSRRDHAAFALRCKELGLGKLGQRVQLEQALHELSDAAVREVSRAAPREGHPRINYVIATFEGFTKRTHYYPPPGKVLCYHLDKLSSLSHELARITVVKADSSGCSQTIPGVVSAGSRTHEAAACLTIGGLASGDTSRAHLGVTSRACAIPCRSTTAARSTIGSVTRSCASKAARTMATRWGSGSRFTRRTATSSITTSSWRLVL